MTKRLIPSFILLMAAADPGRAQWKSAHANAANTGYAVVDTIPAAHPVGYADVGPVADGANPVIGADGAVYIGNMRGELFALYPDGNLFWKRQLDTMYAGIYTSPVIGADGAIYVVSQAIVRDSNNVPHSYSYLHKFSPASAWLSWVRFPLQNPAFRDWVNGGGSSGPPNIWRFNGAEVIMVPVWCQVFTNWELRLIAFSTNGGALAVQPVTTVLSGGYTGDTEWCIFLLPLCISYSEPILDIGSWPMQAWQFGRIHSDLPGSGLPITNAPLSRTNLISQPASPRSTVSVITTIA